MESHLKAIALEAAKGIEAYDQGDKTQARISLEAIGLWAAMDAGEIRLDEAAEAAEDNEGPQTQFGLSI